MALINYWSPDVVEMIFQHLSPKEKLLAMEVASSWSDFLVKIHISKKFWDNIGVEVNKENEDQLTKSIRPYRNVRVKGINISTLEKVILEPKKVWKSVEMENIEFNDLSELSKVFQKIKETAENLEIKNISCKSLENADEEPAFVFPRLRNLLVQVLHKDQAIAVWVNKKIEANPALKLIIVTEDRFTIEHRTENISGKSNSTQRITFPPLEALARVRRDRLVNRAFQPQTFVQEL